MGVPIVNRLTVVGIAIDKVDKNLVVTAQIIVPSNTSTEGGGGNDSKVLKAEANTLSDAFDKLSESTLMPVSMSHCSLIILGEETMKNDSYNVLDYLTRNAYISENIILAAAEGNAGDLFTYKPALADAASLSLSKLLKLKGNLKNTNLTTVKQFFVNYFTVGQTNTLPVITAKPIFDKEESGEKSTDTKQEYLLDTSKSAVIAGNSLVGFLDKNGAASVNYVKNKIIKGSFSLSGENNEEICLYILANSKKLSYDLEKKEVKVELKIQTVLKEIIAKTTHTELQVELSEGNTERLKELIRADVLGTFDSTKENADVYNLLEGFYKKEGKDALPLTLSDVKLTVDVKVEFA